MVDGSNNDNDTDTDIATRSSSTTAAAAAAAADSDSDSDDIPDAVLDPSPENTIHSKGNLVMVVGSSSPGHRQRSIRVQAETIEHFGPLWLDMVKESYRERLLSTRRTAYLPDDDADMMLVLMYLSHSWHVGKVPKKLSFKQLLAMTRICEKYDMNTQVSPFVRRWIVPHQEKLLSPGREEWLFIAHQFGLERHYVTLASHLVLSCRTEGGRTLFTPGRGEKLEGLVPEGALGGFPSSTSFYLSHFSRGCFVLRWRLDLLTPRPSRNPPEAHNSALGLPRNRLQTRRPARERRHVPRNAGTVDRRARRRAARSRARNVHALQPRRASPLSQDPRLLAAHRASRHP
ncbi:hypothetical protein P171DRAFT_238980 [Karstenula rhodostoma CBS 690.94]|uniref:BTB domain-containing protein n=1 Tax=Karstenula rhodostoma CBS 690.94 TaxID=1392251 RepID=A0A9P4UEU3_9PLEO|nr:hypothetical protein P171DRAFT_238980 [Karstenula rhodostoma CBS 690.94]